MTIVTPVAGARDRADFIDVPYRHYAGDPHWVPPLRREAAALIDPKKNPFFGHAEVALFLARRDGNVIGRIAAHLDHLALKQPIEQGMGPGTGNWGLFEATDAATARALIEAAERWLVGRGMIRALGPISLSIWEEPGLLVRGQDHAPTVMMGHHDARYRGWIEAAGYRPAKSLLTYDLKIDQAFPPLIERIVEAGERNPRIRVRRVDKSRFDQEAAIILAILNEAWADNWGFVPLTDAEIAHTGKQLKPIVFEDLVMIGELDGEPVAFMITLPDMNEVLATMDGRLFPFGWLKLLRWLRRPQVRTMRVPLMGVVKRLQASRMASQFAFMMIEFIRREATVHYGATRGEIGWVLDDNKGMRGIAEAIESRINREYLIFDKPIGEGAVVAS